MILRGTVASALLFFALVAGAQEPKWLTDARAREAKAGSPREFKSKDNWFKAKVPAKVVGPVEKVEESYSIEFDLGAETPTYCELVPDGFDMADMLRRTLDLTMEQVAQSQGKVEARQLEFTDAGAIGNVPYLETHWLYRVNDGKEARLGQFKQFVMVKGGHGLYCAHVDIGYVKTFDNLMRALAQTLEVSTPVPAPYYEEIAVATVGGMKAGVTMMTLERDADGDTKSEQVTAMMMPAAGGELHTQDAVTKEWVRPDATLINAAHFIAENGELNTSIGLKQEDDTWVIDGDLQGKKVNAQLPADSTPGTWLAQALGIRQLLASENPVGAEHSIAMWVATDPSKLTDAKTKVLAKQGKEFTGHSTTGALEADVTLDKSGALIIADMQVGPQKVKIERVYVNGSF